jgi:2-keto-4-pentenoate hydratase
VALFAESKRACIMVVLGSWGSAGKFGHTLKAGDFVITGATCILPPTDYEEGDLVEANFVGLGKVTLSTGGGAKL